MPKNKELKLESLIGGDCITGLPKRDSICLVLSALKGHILGRQEKAWKICIMAPSEGT